MRRIILTIGLLLWGSISAVSAQNNGAYTTISTSQYYGTASRWLSITTAAESNLSSDSALMGTFSSEESSFIAGPWGWLQFGIACSLFVVLILLLLRALKRSQKLPLNYYFDTRSGWRTAIYFNLLLIAFTASLAYLVLSNIEQKVKNDTHVTLQMMLKGTQNALHVWVREQKDAINIIAANPVLLELTERQIEQYQSLQGLRRTKELDQLRALFGGNEKSLGNSGFFLNTPDGVNIASMRDSNLGITNIIQRHRPDLMQRVLLGETMMVPPIPSDVAIPGADTISHLRVPPSMFFAAPVRNNKGSVVAVVALRLDPHGDFSRIHHLGRIGKTGETYAFNKNGLLLSSSRFTKQLIDADVLKKSEQSILSLSIHEPNVNFAANGAIPVTNAKSPLTAMARNAATDFSDHNMQGYLGYRGTPVMGVWTWDAKMGIGVATEIELAEAMEVYHRVWLALIIVMAIILPLMVIFTLIVMNTGRRSHHALCGSLQRTEIRLGQSEHDLQVAQKEVVSAQRALNKKQELHRSMVGNIPGVVYTCEFDKEWTMLFISEYIEQISGYPSSDFVRNEVRSYASIIYPEDIPTVDNAVDQGIASDGFFEIEYRIVNKNGDICWVFERGQAVRTEHDLVDHLDGFIMDITQHKHFEAELILAEQKLLSFKKSTKILQFAMDKIEEMVFGLSLEDCCLFYINKPGAEQLGYTQEAMQGMSISSIDPEFTLEQGSVFAGPLRNGVPIVFTSEFHTRDEFQIPVEVTFRLIDYGNKDLVLASFKRLDV